MNKAELTQLIAQNAENPDPEILAEARRLCDSVYGKQVFMRGLIEFTNYCKNNCYYCGIRAANGNVHRYRLTKEDILTCCDIGYNLGFRTYVLQGGEDPYFTDDIMCDIVSDIRRIYPDCAITLSLGERSKESYQRLYNAGANRYLLRHETATDEHYSLLHPENLLLSNRKQCLRDLKEIGFQTGAGFMVGSPGQTYEMLAEDLLFLKDLQPEMVGIGPFIPHADTPFREEAQGSLNLTLLMVALTRLMLPTALLPATTALGSIDPSGREQGLKAGANVVMPNLSPLNVRKDYSLYDNKICTGDEAAECRMCIQRRIQSSGFELSTGRGDHIGNP
nr:[FeFe] hydrogenase H-cluster radical SAM maturase HydE [Scatolibacter rhodanostii]